MIKFKKIFGWGVLLLVLILANCAKNPTKPSTSESGFTMIIEYGEITHGLFKKKTNDQEELKKPLSVQQYNMARIMVLDFTKYGNFDNFEQSADGVEYFTDLNAWTGNRDSWAEWKGFLGNYFSIVSDQTLNIGAELATGTVTGVSGRNHFFMAFTDGDILEYQGEGEADGVAGETVDVNITIEAWNVDDDNWDDDTWWDDPTINF